MMKLALTASLTALMNPKRRRKVNQLEIKRLQLVKENGQLQKKEKLEMQAQVSKSS